MSRIQNFDDHVTRLLFFVFVTVLYGKKSRIFGQIFGIQLFLDRVLGGLGGISGVIFGGFSEAF